MALSRIKRWNRNEILLSADLNAEFDNITGNSSSLVFPLTANINVGGYLLQNAGFSSPLQLHDNLHCIDKYSNDLGAAIAGIGGSSITLLVGSIITVSGTHSVPANIHLWFVGQGALSTTGGSTVTFATPSQITATTQQTIFSGSGTILFTAAGVVSPAWFGFLATASAADNKTAYNACTASLSTAGGVVVIPAGTYSVNGSLTHGNKPIVVVGTHPEMSIISSTSTTSLAHGMVFTRSFQVRHLQVKTSSDLTTNNQQHAIRLDLDGVTVSGGNQAVVIEDVKVRGFNDGIYLDGGAAYNVDRASIHNIDIKVAGPASDYVGSCIYGNRITQLEMSLLQLDQNDTGEHAIYCFGSLDILIDGVKIRNASRGNCQAIKLVGQGIGSSSARYPLWNIKNFDIAQCTNGVMCTVYDAEKLGALKLENGRMDDITGIVGVPGVLFAEALGTSVIETVLMDNMRINDVGYQGMHLSTAVGAKFLRATVKDVSASNWSTASSTNYTLFGTNGTGAWYNIRLENIDADGETNGRTIVSSAGNATSYVALNISWENLTERNTAATAGTVPGRPVPFTDGDTTPSLAIGRHFYANSTGATVITSFDDVVKGERYLIEFANGNTTLTNGARIFLNGGVNFVGSSSDMLQLLCTDDTAGSTIMKQIAPASVN